MTDVVITKRIPGHKAGDVVELDDRMRKHVAAGNAEILPNEHPAWDDEGAKPVHAPTAYTSHSSGVSGGPTVIDTDDEDGDEETAEVVGEEE